jgi:hypothetical protein
VQRDAQRRASAGGQPLARRRVERERACLTCVAETHRRIVRLRQHDARIAQRHAERRRACDEFIQRQRWPRDGDRRWTPPALHRIGREAPGTAEQHDEQHHAEQRAGAAMQRAPARTQ